MALDCYIEISDIEGESEAKGYEKWIKADEFSLGVASTGGHTTSLYELTFSHPIDKASAKLFQACATDQDLTKVKVALLEEGQCYMEYLLEPGTRSKGADANVCRITAVNPNAGATGGGDRPREKVSIRYGKITVTYADGNIQGVYDASLS